MVGSFGCCARATSGHVAAAPPANLMNSRRFTPSSMMIPPAGPSFASDRVALHAVAGHIVALRDFNPSYVG